MRMVTDRPGAAVILAAGYGSRMGSLTATQPKCLLAVGGRSLIEAQVGSLERFGVHDITVVVMKVKLAKDRIVGFGKQLCAAEAGCENVGILKFGRESGRRLAHILDRLVPAGHENAWVPLAFAEIARERPLWAVPTGGVPWTEIDFPEDLERARHLVAPVAVPRSERVADAATC